MHDESAFGPAPHEDGKEGVRDENMRAGGDSSKEHAYSENPGDNADACSMGARTRGRRGMLTGLITKCAHCGSKFHAYKGGIHARPFKPIAIILLLAIALGLFNELNVSYNGAFAAIGGFGGYVLCFMGLLRFLDFQYASQVFSYHNVVAVNWKELGILYAPFLVVAGAALIYGYWFLVAHIVILVVMVEVLLSSLYYYIKRNKREHMENFGVFKGTSPLLPQTFEAIVAIIASVINLTGYWGGMPMH